MLSDYLTLFAGYVRFLRTLSGLPAEECVWLNTLPIVFTMGSSGVRISSRKVVADLPEPIFLRRFGDRTGEDPPRFPSLILHDEIRFTTQIHHHDEVGGGLCTGLSDFIAVHHPPEIHHLLFLCIPQSNRENKHLIGREVVNSFREIPR